MLRVAPLLLLLAALPAAAQDPREDLRDWIEALGGDDTAARLQARARLLEFGEGNLAQLIRFAAFSPSEAGQREMADVLATLGDRRPGEFVDAALHVYLPGEEGPVLLAMTRLGPKVVPHLQRGLEGFRDEAAARMLGHLGGAARAALPALREAAKRERFSPMARGAIAAAIARVTADPEERVRVLVDAVAEWPTRDVVLVLQEVGPRAREAVPHLRRWSAEADEATALEILRALWRIEGDAGAVLPELVSILVRPAEGYGRYMQDHARSEALALVSEMGPAARAASGPLLELQARGGGPEVSSALESTGIDPHLAPRMTRWVETGCLEARRVAVRALQRIGLRVGPGLVALLAVDDKDLRRAVRDTFEASGLPEAEITALLKQALPGASEDLAIGIVRELAVIGPGAADAIPEMRAAYRDPGGGVRAWVLWAFGRMGEAGRAGLPEVVDGLSCGDNDVMLNAVGTLDDWKGAGATEAIPALRKILAGPPTDAVLHAGRVLIELVGDEVLPDVARAAGPCLWDERFRNFALWTLGDCGKHARQYHAVARALLKAPDVALRVRAAYLLLRTGGKGDVELALASLKSALDGDRDRGFRDACYIVEVVGKRCEPLRETLAKLALDLSLEPRNRDAAADALKALDR